MYSCYNSWFFFKKKTATKKQLWYPIAWCWFRTLSHERKKNIWCSCVLFPIFMFWYSRFSFRNLKDVNSCMFSWCITNSSLTIFSWHDMTLSLFLQWMYSMHNKCLYQLCARKFWVKWTKSIIDKTVPLYYWFSFEL